jgi:hypothetical protein
VLSLVDLLDRLLAGGVMLTGDITISLADVDLVHVSLRALISSVATLAQPGGALPDAALTGVDRAGPDLAAPDPSPDPSPDLGGPGRA